MVVRTPTLNSLKRGFLSQIHQPLPLTRRESQQLLDSITASFRKNLDKEHPWQSDDTPPAATDRSAREDDAASHRTARHPHHHHPPTDRHLRAILSNPLFSHPQQHDSTSSNITAAPTKDPYYVFNTAVSKGLMTTRRAAGFLATVRAQAVKGGPGLDIRAQLAPTGAGLHVVKWLRSSGQESDLRFLSDSALVQQLVPFMYAEGLEEVAWTWLAQLAAQRLMPLGLQVSDQPLFKLLGAVMRETGQPAAETKPNLDASYSALLRANQMLPRDHPVSSISMKNAWAGLSWASTVEALERPKPSVPLFESFVDLGRPYNLPLDLAHLDLHHPTAPSSNSAVHYMHSRFDETRDLDSMRLKDRYQKRLIFLALDTADRLKQTGNTTEASWVETLLAKMCENLNLGGILNPTLLNPVASK